MVRSMGNAFILSMQIAGTVLIMSFSAADTSGMQLKYAPTVMLAAYLHLMFPSSTVPLLVSTILFARGSQLGK